MLDTWEGPVDIADIDTALREKAATHETLVELASRCEHPRISKALRSNEAADPRWRLALRGVLAAAGRTIPIPDSSAERLGSLEHLTQIVPVRGGYLCLARERGAQDATLVRMDHDFAVLASRPLVGLGNNIAVLPQALRHVGESTLVLYIPGTPNRSCFVLDDALHVVSRADVTLPHHRGEVRYSERLGEELVIEGNHAMCWAALRDADDVLSFPDVDASYGPPRRFLSESYFGFVRRVPVWVDGWLTMAGNPELVKGKGWISRELHWVHLDRDVVHTTSSWPRSSTAWTLHGDALWLASEEGLHRSEPGGEVELVREKPRHYYGLGSGAEGLILTTRSDEWVTADHEGNEELRGALPSEASPFATCSLGDGLLVGSRAWAWVGSEGLRASSPRDGAVTVPGDRHVARGFVSGRSGFAVDGSSLVRVDFPADAVAEASFGELVVAHIGGIRYAFGVDGICRLAQDQLSAPVRTHYGGGSKRDGGVVEDERILLGEAGGSDVYVWRPSDLVHATLVPPAVRQIEDQKSEGCQKFNPRDDWADPGLEVDGEIVFARRSRYGGDWGAAGDAAAVLARRGAIVTLEDCVLIRGGMLVEGHSTVIAVRCALMAGSYRVLPGSHLVLVDCDVSADANLTGSVLVANDGVR